MRLTLYTLLLISTLAACNTRKQPVNKEDFQFKYLDLSISGSLFRTYCYNKLIIGMSSDKKFFVIDSNYNHSLNIENKLNSLPDVSDIQFYKNDILLELDNDKIIVFDSIFNRKNDVESTLNKLSPTSLFYYNDSFYVFNSKDYFLVNKDYTTTFIDSATFFNIHYPTNFALGPPVYTDSTYNVYVSGFGEFGGNIYFQNKVSLQTYYLPTYFGGLFYYRNAYHLINKYTYVSKYIRIEDPTKLYPVKIMTQPSFCINCDSGHREYFYKMTETERKKWEIERGITTYFDTNQIQTLTTFLLDDTLYSLCMTDTSFLVLQHTDTIKFIKSTPRMDKRIKGYHYTMKAFDEQRQVIGLDGTYWRMLDSAGLDRQVDQVGLIVIQGREINICESYNTKLVKARRINK